MRGFTLTSLDEYPSRLVRVRARTVLFTLLPMLDRPESMIDLTMRKEKEKKSFWLLTNSMPVASVYRTDKHSNKENKLSQLYGVLFST